MKTHKHVSIFFDPFNVFHYNLMHEIKIKPEFHQHDTINSGLKSIFLTMNNL